MRRRHPPSNHLPPLPPRRLLLPRILHRLRPPPQLLQLRLLRPRHVAWHFPLRLPPPGLRR
ncbi:hypothetical protein LINPERPRIM_LOCUS26599 [Linum perenne]